MVHFFHCLIHLAPLRLKRKTLFRPLPSSNHKSRNIARDLYDNGNDNDDGCLPVDSKRCAKIAAKESVVIRCVAHFKDH